MFQDRAPLSGTTLDKYELLEKVGEGGMAEVYRGRHTALGRIVAVKVLHPHLSSTERNRLRFEREARAIESLHHDNILQIFDYSGRDFHTCFIVTEFIEGVTLKEMLNREGRLPSELTAMVGIELCRALTYAHERNIIHRDIKPENVMIRNDGTVKLMDFGIARVLDESTMTLTGGLVGSPAYMSPEQASDGDIDHRSDLFSMGTLLYRTATGHLPFTGGNAPVILRNILEGLYVDPLDLEPGMSPLLADIIKQCLSRSPADRPQSAHELEQSLNEVLKQANMHHSTDEMVQFMADPPRYQTQLKETLCVRLPLVGKELIETGDKVTAMRLFNRVLYLDENNEQVRLLIQQLYRSSASEGWRKALLGVAALLALFGAVWGVGNLNGWWDTPVASGPEKVGALPSLSAPAGLNVGLTRPAPEVASGSGVTAPASGTGPLSPPPAGAGTGTASRPGAADVAPGVTVGQTESGSATASPPTPRPSDRPEVRRPDEGSREPTGLRPSRVAQEASSSLQAPQRGQGTGARTGSGTAGTEPSTAGTSTAARSGNPRTGTSAPGASEGVPGLVLVRANYQAELLINGRRYGNTMLLKDPVPLPAGDYALKLSNELCEPFETTIHVAAGKISELQYELKLLPAFITLSGGPSDAEVFLDGVRLGQIATLTQRIPVRARKNQILMLQNKGSGLDRRITVPELEPNTSHMVQLGP